MQHLIYPGECTCISLSVSEEITVVVDKNRQSEFIFKQWTQSHPTSERGEIGQITDDPIFIISRTGEGKTDRIWVRINHSDHLFKTADDRMQTFFQMIGKSRQTNRRNHLISSSERRENEVRSSGIERQYCFVIIVVHDWSFYGSIIICIGERSSGWIWKQSTQKYHSHIPAGEG